MNSTSTSNSNSNPNPNPNSSTIPDPDNQNIYGDINNFLMTPYVLIILIVLFILYLITFLSLGKSNIGAGTGSGTGSNSIFGSGSKSGSNSGSFLDSLYNNSASAASSSSNSISSIMMSPTESSSTSTSLSSSIITIIAVAVIIVLLILAGAQYLFGINVAASINNLLEPQINVAVEQNMMNNNGEPILTEIESDLVNWNTKMKNKMNNQVFNIPGNYYGYEDAKIMCDAYGARLANYDEVEDAYNKGGEWCNYGWSEGQNAFFPTQKSTFDNLQKIKGHEHDCGRPGVNGGYIANPNVKFGVNCYGKKPNITHEEEELMQINTPYPKTEEDIYVEKKVDYWKKHLDDILVSPFNYNSWST